MFHRMMNYGEMEVKPTPVITRELIKKFMPKFKRHDDLIIIQRPAWEDFKSNMPIPVVREENSPFSIDEDELASLVCQTIQKPPCKRLAVETKVENDDFRTPNVELILGDNGIVNHKENHIMYRFDITKCMFSFGNINEKMHMAELECDKEVVVDLFAGIGYFSLPLLIHAKAKHLYACEWNPNAVQTFKKNLKLNKIDPSRCTVIDGDNRIHRPTDVAQRVILGILPSSIDWMKTAFECIDKKTGATLHCHDLVELKVLTPSPTNEQSNTNQPSSSPQTSQQMGEATKQVEQEPTTSGSNIVLEQSTNSSSSSSGSSGSPVLLEKPSPDSSPTSSNAEVRKDCNTSVQETCTTTDSSTTPEAEQSKNDTSSGSSEYFESDHTHDSPYPIRDIEISSYEARAREMIAIIKEDVEAHDLEAKLLRVRPVKSYAPRINHVVFDIIIQPIKKPSDLHNRPNFMTLDQLSLGSDL